MALSEGAWGSYSEDMRRLLMTGEMTPAMREAYERARASVLAGRAIPAQASTPVPSAPPPPRPAPCPQAQQPAAKASAEAITAKPSAKARKPDTTDDIFRRMAHERGMSLAQFKSFLETRNQMKTQAVSGNFDSMLEMASYGAGDASEEEQALAKELLQKRKARQAAAERYATTGQAKASALSKEEKYVLSRMGGLPQASGVIRNGRNLELHPMTHAEAEAACKKMGV